MLTYSYKATMLKYLLMNNVISMWFWIYCKKSPQGLYHGIDWNLCWQEMSGKSQGIFFCQPHGNPLVALQWRHDGYGSISNHHPHDCLLNRLFRRRSKLCVTGLCAGNSPGTGDNPAQMASNDLMTSSWLGAIRHSKRCGGKLSKCYLWTYVTGWVHE